MFVIIGDFPVFQASVREELRQDEALLRTAVTTIPNNPVVFVRIGALLSPKADILCNENMSSADGLNYYVAQTGFFLAICDTMVSRSFLYASYGA